MKFIKDLKNVSFSTMINAFCMFIAIISILTVVISDMHNDKVFSQMELNHVKEINKLNNKLLVKDRIIKNNLEALEIADLKRMLVLNEEISRGFARLQTLSDADKTLFYDKEIRNIIKISNPKMPIKEQNEYIKYIFMASKKFDINPILIASIIHRESNYKTHVVSSVGAKGPMQVYPKWHRDKLARLQITENDLQTIKWGILVGTEIIKEFLKYEKGNIRKALYRYVGGAHHSYVNTIIDMTYRTIYK